MTAPAAAQTRPAGDASGAESAGAPSPESLARIRAALAADRRGRESSRGRLGEPVDGWIAAPRPTVGLAPGLGFREGLGIYDDLTRGREPVPLGGPTHRAMLRQMTPREVNEAVSSDALGIGTASVFAVVPHAIRKIAGWFRGSGPPPPAHLVLTAQQEAAVIEDMRANVRVLDAGLRQHGRTVTLSLLVPAGTEPRAAREIGERFVRLVSRRAEAPARDGDPAGDAGIDGAGGAGTFDYVVSVRSPADAVIAHGGKATTEPLVRW